MDGYEPRVGDIVHIRGTVRSLDANGGFNIDTGLMDTYSFFTSDEVAAIVHVEPRLFSVGDNVRFNDSPNVYRIIAINGDEAWIKDIAYHESTGVIVSLSNLSHS